MGDYSVAVHPGLNYEVNPDENFNGALNVSASVIDLSGTKNAISFDIDVNPVNDLPVIFGLAIAVPDFVDNLVVYNFSDIDGDSESGSLYNGIRTMNYSESHLHYSNRLPVMKFGMLLLLLAMELVPAAYHQTV